MDFFWLNSSDSQELNVYSNKLSVESTRKRVKMTRLRVKFTSMRALFVCSIKKQNSAGMRIQGLILKIKCI
jgi:hypothetical protein